jgi:acetyltransferase-like isoleucine patch superfamily enzyme
MKVGKPSSGMTKDVEIGENVIISNGAVVENGVKIGNNAHIGNNSVILEGTVIGNNVKIGHCTVLGQQPLKGLISTRKVSENPPLTIQDDCVIGSLVCISAGTKLSEGVLIGDHASIREGNTIGERTIIGKAVNMEYDSKIGSCCKIMNSCHLTGNMLIGDYVFLGPMVTTMNDKYMDTVHVEMRGPTICDHAVVGSNSTLLPSVKIGEYAVVGAGSVVLQDVPSHALAVGVPAKVVRQVLKGFPLKLQDQK